MCFGIKSNKIVPIVFEKKEGFHTENCSICLELISDSNDIAVLPCKHKFHSKCILNWFSKNMSCPICRLRVEWKLRIKNSYTGC